MQDTWTSGKLENFSYFNLNTWNNRIFPFPSFCDLHRNFEEDVRNDDASNEGCINGYWVNPAFIELPKSDEHFQNGNDVSRVKKCGMILKFHGGPHTFGHTGSLTEVP